MTKSARIDKQNRRIAAGSPQVGEPVFLVVGLVGRPHGLQGDMHFQILTDFPERLVPGARVYIGAERRPYAIGQLKGHGKHSLLRLDGVESREAAALLRNTGVFVRTADLPPLADGEFYQHQVIGLQVVDEQGADLGVISEIISTGANDVLVVVGATGGEILVPRLDDVVLDVDLDTGRLTVRLPGGLIP